MSIYLDSNSDFYDWAEANGYNCEDERDLVEEVFKRGAHVRFYIPKEGADTFALVTAYQSYDNGRQDIEIHEEGLKRVERQVVTTSVTYE